MIKTSLLFPPFEDDDVLRLQTHKPRSGDGGTEDEGMIAVLATARVDRRRFGGSYTPWHAVEDDAAASNEGNGVWEHEGPVASQEEEYVPEVSGASDWEDLAHQASVASDWEDLAHEIPSPSACEEFSHGDSVAQECAVLADEGAAPSTSEELTHEDSAVHECAELADEGSAPSTCEERVHDCSGAPQGEELGGDRSAARDCEEQVCTQTVLALSCRRCFCMGVLFQVS